MGFMDMLKAKPEPRNIQEDGKSYQFTPGEEGSLVTKGKPAMDIVPPPPAKKAKVITPKDQEIVQTASQRG